MKQLIQILHIEDNKNDARLVATLLKDGGVACDLSVVDTREAYLAALEGGAFDLIISDYSIPSYNGKSALQAATEKCPSTPFIFVSGTIGEEAAVDSLLSGASDYVLKQNLKRLVPAVNRVLREASQRRELQRVEDQLRQMQKVDSLGRLAGGVAHDFNNVLTVIMGYADLVRGALPTDDPLQDRLDQIKKAAERAAALTRQLLAFGRKQIMSPRVIDLNSIVTDMNAMLGRLIGEDVEVQMALNPHLGPMRGDPTQIEQIIVNLAVNSRDAMPNGGVLTLETDNVTLDGAYARRHVSVQPGSYVMLAVSDTGLGMDEKTQLHLFEPFFTTKEQGKGTGLGLATVYGIVKQSGGNIWVYSEPGHGTTFKVYFPVVQESVEAPAPNQPLSSPVGGSETILVVEDQDEVRKLICAVLRHSGYGVLESSNGGEALLVCERYRETIHLMVTDVVMPGMSGRELSDRIALLRPAMKVLYLSGYTSNAIVHHGVLDAGILFLQKPFTPLILAQKVREVLDSAAGPR